MLILVFSVVFFGVLGGLIMFAIAEAAMVGIDFLTPDPGPEVGPVVR